MTDYSPIACDDYDFLEIACMDQYRVELTLDAGEFAGSQQQDQDRGEPADGTTGHEPASSGVIGHISDHCVTGTAVDLQISHGAEFLILQPEQGKPQRIRLDRIRLMRVMTRPSRFTEHQFRANND